MFVKLTIAIVARVLMTVQIRNSKPPDCLDLLGTAASFSLSSGSACSTSISWLLLLLELDDIVFTRRRCVFAHDKV